MFESEEMLGITKEEEKTYRIKKEMTKFKDYSTNNK